MQVGQSLNRIGEGLLVDLRVVSPDAVADGAVGDGGKFETHGKVLVPAVKRFRYF